MAKKIVYLILSNIYLSLFIKINQTSATSARIRVQNGNRHAQLQADIAGEFTSPYLTESQCHATTRRSIVALGRKRNEIVREEMKGFAEMNAVMSRFTELCRMRVMAAKREDRVLPP